MASAWNSEPPERREYTRERDKRGYRYSERVVRNEGAAARGTAHKMSQVIWLIFGVIMGMIGIRIVLRLVAADPANPFADFVYSFTDLFLWPFFGLTAEPAAGGFVLEIPAIIALLVYALLAWFLVKLVWVIFDRPTSGTVEIYEDDHREIR